MSDNITVQVKSPSLQETLEISLAQDATIDNLKQEIQRVHPQHPLTTDQRIIHSGKLLDNGYQIENLLKKSEDNVAPTFHLVVKPTSSSSRQTTTNMNINNTVPPIQPTPIQSTPVQPTMPDIQTQSYSGPQNQMNNTNLPQYPPLLPGGYQVVALNGQYYLAPVLVPSMQPMPVQAHAEQPLFTPTFRHDYIPEVGHRYTQQYTQQPQTQPLAQEQGQQQPFQPQAQQAPPFQPQAQGQQRQLQPQAIIRNIAGFLRPANGQLAGNIWLAMKLYFMIFILSQGASLERILLFHALALVLFLYQTGRLRVVVHRARRPRTVPTTAFEVIKRGIYMFFLSFWPNFNQDQQHTE